VSTGLPRAQTVGILAVGDELLAGAHPDLNSPYLARRLGEWGREVLEVRAVRDVEVDIARAAAELLERYGLVLVTGGLGPTEDDVTRHGVARALDLPLIESIEAWEQVLAWYARADRIPPESNRRQALTPEGASVVANPAGTAPGFRAEHSGSTILVLPGPPREVEAVFNAEVAPWLDANPVQTGATAIRRLYLADLSESIFADKVNHWMARDANPLLGVTVKGGILSLRVLARAETEAEAESMAQSRADELATLFPEHLFSRWFNDPARELAQELISRDISVTAAESCTAGRVASALGSVPGISAVLSESLVSYSNAIKTKRLGVPAELLETHGAVSEPVVRAMAKGAAERTGARLAIAVSGIAGPGGGTDAKPVGLVWFATCFDGEVHSVERRWPPVARDRIQIWATQKALCLALAAVR
jgi:nicotinamide-nucleotide amidase